MLAGRARWPIGTELARPPDFCPNSAKRAAARPPPSRALALAPRLGGKERDGCKHHPPLPLLLRSPPQRIRPDYAVGRPAVPASSSNRAFDIQLQQPQHRALILQQRRHHGRPRGRPGSAASGLTVLDPFIGLLAQAECMSCSPHSSSQSAWLTLCHLLQPQQQLSQIEKSVTHLLVATKQLLETLTHWSRGQATEGEVSDVYVRLGYEFNIACRAFNAIGVDTNDLGPVPDLLRAILEDTLSQEASQASLDKFLPRIRDIIINLLQGLKKKQSRLRAKTAKELERSGSSSRQDTLDNGNGLGIELQDPPSRQTSARAVPIRQGSRDVPQELPPRTSSRNEGRASPAFLDRPGDKNDSRGTLTSTSSMSSTTAQNMPVLPPYPEDETMPDSTPQPPPHAINAQNFPHPPPPPPKQQDALLALQRGGDLERRASRRFSTYQIKQQLGGSANGIPMIPPAQNSPVPNRGREVRESIQAVRQRGSQLYQRSKTERRLVGEHSPSRNSHNLSVDDANRDAAQYRPESPTVVLSEDTLSPISRDENPPGKAASRANLANSVVIPSLVGPPAEAPFLSPARQISRLHAEPVSPAQFVPEESPQPGKPLALFLQYKGKVKKIILDDGANDLSVARLQLAFIDKFAWNTQGDGVDLPEIYIQDTGSGVRYELEDLNDIKQNTVLVLNVEPLDEVKRHIDDGLTSLRVVIEGIRTAVIDQQSALQRVDEKQQEAAKELAGLSATPRLPSSSLPPTPGQQVFSPVKVPSEALSDVQTLRRDLAVMRQTYSSFVSDINASMSAIRTKAASVKSTAAKVSLPEMSGETGRAYVNQGLDVLSKEQQKMVETIDEVQDSVEDLRKDVVTRGVRPLPRQLEQVAKDIADATAAVKRMEASFTKEKPLWSKIWKAELQQVCDDRDMIAEAEALVADFKADLEQSDETFKLVEEATKQQHLVAATPDSAAGPRSLSGAGRIAALNMDQAVDPRKAKDGVLGEVKGLKVDHEERLEAISRAEKARQKELESRSEGAFKKELGSFVDEGKLKKTGGFEEVERQRKVREDRARQEFGEMQEQRRREAAEKKKAAAAARADAARAEAAPPAQKPAALAVGGSQGAGPTTSPGPPIIDAQQAG